MTAKVDIIGNTNKVINVAGDFSVNHGQDKPVFYEPVLERYKQAKPGEFIKPNVAEFIKTVKTKHLLILGGPYQYKLEVARYCSWFLQASMRSQSSAKTILPVLEWYRSADPQGLVHKLEKTKDTTIFILPDISPFDINHDIEGIARACAHKHFVLISTDKPDTQWNLPDSIKGCWQTPHANTLYRPADLVTYLKIKLRKESLDISPIVSGGGLEKSLDKFAQTLKTPEKIDTFVQLLVKDSASLTLAVLQQNLELAQKDNEMIAHWFKHLLNDKEQLLALGLCFFDGLFEDQLFAALEYIFDGAWRARDGSLKLLDYGDLSNLLNYFRFVKTDIEQSKIESRYAGQRLAILDTAWHTHRRAIRAALPVLVKLVRDSVAGRSKNAELYGDKPLRDQLRKVVGDTISDIGRMSFNTVENTLLALAADNEIGVQSVAARAMASWRQDNSVDYIKVLKRWRDDSEFIAYISSVFDSIQMQRQHNASVYVRTTIALSVGYTALYFPPGRLDNDVLELFDSLSSDRESAVAYSFGHQTIKLMLPIHLKQLHERVVGLTQHAQLYYALANALGLASQESPTEVLRVVDRWTEHLQIPEPRDIDFEEVTKREMDLATAALTYASIRFNDSIISASGVLSPQWAFDQITQILDTRRHLFVRQNCLFAVSQLVEFYFEQVEGEFKRLIEKLDEQERQKMVQLLANIYKAQRKELKGGDEVMTVDNQRYPIFIDSERPKTQIEKAMHSWSITKSNRAAIQLAFAAEVAFREALEGEEEAYMLSLFEAKEAAKKAEQEKQKHQEEKKVINDDKFVTPKLSFAMDKFIVPLATIGESQETRDIVRDVLPEVLSKSDELREQVLKKYEKDGREDLARSIKKAMRFSNRSR